MKGKMPLLVTFQAATVANCKADRNCNDSSYSTQWCAGHESTLASACGIGCFILP